MTPLIDTLRTARASQTGVVLDAKTLALLLAEIDAAVGVKTAPVGAPEPQPPLECWINDYKGGTVLGYRTRETALMMARAVSKHSTTLEFVRTAVHMREVTE